jgi:filamentous hemagglutinin
VEQGEGHARETFQLGRPTAAGGGLSSSSGSRSSSSGQPQGVPYGFRDFGQFREFSTRFRDRMRELYPDLDLGFQGSSVTGRSAETGAPFDEGRVSDYDIAISGDSVNRAAHENGVQFRGDGVSTGPLSERDLDRLGLDGIVEDASAGTGREVHVMIFRTIEEAAGRKPTIKVWF